VEKNETLRDGLPENIVVVGDKNWICLNTKVKNKDIVLGRTNKYMM